MDRTEIRQTILLVDDEPDLRDTMREYLESKGFAVVEAHDASSCRQALTRSKIDLAILDIGLPGEDGLSLCRDLRQNSTMGLIVVTGSIDSVDRVVSLELGADDFISKPVNLRELAARVRSVLRRVTAHRPAWGDTTDPVEKLDRFAADLLGRPHRRRVLLSVLFTDIVDSTVMASKLGDRQWSALLEKHDDIVRDLLEDAGGLEVKTTGDGFLAAFHSPSRAIQCAIDLRDRIAEHGIRVRAGIHTGECELREGDLAGIAVHLAARIVSLAGSDEVLVSSTVKDLTIGAPVRFEDRGTTELKGFDRQWQIFAVGLSSTD